MMFCIDPDLMPCLWQVMWFQLHQLEGDRCCEHEGEVWQYMGSKVEGGNLVHTFRHRCHPKTHSYAYRHISTPLGVPK
jgi:hypothetical protein